MIVEVYAVSWLANKPDVTTIPLLESLSWCSTTWRLSNAQTVFVCWGFFVHEYGLDHPEFGDEATTAIVGTK